MARSILVQDPHHDYAVQLIQRAHVQHGLRAVCLYTDRRRRTEGEATWPLLRSEAVEAVYDVEREDQSSLAERLAGRHAIAAVVPHVEDTVLPMAILGEALGVPWNPVEVISLFRDKYAMKAHLRAVAPALRMNRSWRVSGPAAVFALGDVARGRFVLKPNSGFGNRHVAVLGPDASRTQIRTYFARVPGENHVLEEWVDGPEYFVNGYVDAEGHLSTVAVFAYHRVEANGRPDIDFESWNLRHDDPLFHTCAEYAASVVAATGLRRSPFHLELKLDDQGPCLIEVAARLPGMGNAHECNRLHGPRFDYFDAVLRGLLGPKFERPLNLDWSHHDRLHVRYVHGIATRAETVRAIRGLAEVEKLPSFSRWAKRPVLGERLEPTSDCLSLPWSVVLAASSTEQLDDDAGRVRALVRLNDASPVGTLLGRARTARARVERAVRWQLASLSPPADGEPPHPAVPTWHGLVEQGRVWAKEGRSRLERRLLEHGIGRHYSGQLERPLTPSQIEHSEAVMRWAREFLARPHPKLGRKGPVCPFVQHTIERDRFFLLFHPEVDGSDRRPMRDILLSHADDLKRRFPYDSAQAAFTSLLVLFPNVPPERMAVLDDLHEELKTHCMQHDVMLAAFHPLCEKGGIWNASFRDVFKAPLPCFAVRHLDVRDIIFLGHNPQGFSHYHARFGERFASGEVDDEFGYLTAYNESRRRFGI